MLVLALVCTSAVLTQYASTASAAPAGPGDPALSGITNISSRTIPDDQFTVTITDPSSTSTTGTTTGSTTGPQTGSGEVAGPIAATIGAAYTVAQTSSSGDIGEYTVTYSCVDTADPNQRVVASGTGASFNLTFPAAVAGETVPLVACTFTDVAVPTAGQGSSFDCSGSTIYDLARSSSQSNGVNGELDAVVTSTIGNANATVARIAQVPGGGNANALGITRGGTRAYMVNQNPGAASTTTVHEYVAATQAWSTFTGSAQPNASFVAGAVDPHSGIYYYADFAAGRATVFGFDTTTNTAIPGVIGSFALTDGGNGDMAFDSLGNLYVVSSAGLNGDLEVVPGPLPTTGANANLTAVSLDTYTLASATDQYNGIAFDNAGRLYIQHLTSANVSEILEVNPNTGAVIAGPTTESTDASHPRIDLGACSQNPVMELQKVVNSRANPTDEFGLSITGGGVTDGNTATTVGSAVGLQKNPDGTVTNAGPVVGVQSTTYTFTETATSGSLGNYSTSYQCVDVNSPSQTVVASGTGATFQLLFPGPAPGESGPAIICTFTNTANPVLQLTKVLGGSRVNAGDQFTMAIHIGGPTGTVVNDTTNSTSTGTGSTVDPGTGTTGTVFAQPGQTYYLTEDAAGGANLGEYTPTITCVDASGLQSNLPRNAPFPGAIAITPVAGADISCALTNTPLEPDLVVSKSVNPSSTTPVDVGQVLTYTLTFDNTNGKAPASVNYTDDLTKVLDDATLNGQPSQATGTGLLVGGVTSGTFTISGSVAAGQTATVTYSMTVNSPDTGDHQLDNFLVVTGTTPPPSCVATDPLCTTNPVPDLVVSKAVTPVSSTPVTEGQLLTYTLTFDNTNGKAPAKVDWTDDASKVLDDATVTSPPSEATGSGLTVGSFAADNTFAIGGSVAPGAVATVTYQVRVNSPDAGDHQLDNFLVVTGTTPPPSCVATDPLCTTNPVPALVVSKSVNPASTTPVTEGQVLTYTLTFDNTNGKAPASVNYTDDLTKVLDDADVTTQPSVASGAGLIAGLVTGTTFPVTGTLAAGASATVTYRVTVHSPDTGDHQLDNFLVVTGNAPPPSCVATDPLCTTNPVPGLAVSKSVNPASGTTVVQGQVLTYTLTFDNTNGKAPAAVDYTDDLTKVTDDASITSGPVVASGSGLSIGNNIGDTYEISGTLAAGASETITYQVTVDTPDVGDHRLDNFLVVTGTTPPPSCVASDPLCTTNPVPALVVSKSVNPASTTPVAEGQVLTYTLTFDNSAGKAPATVDWTDDLSKVLDDATVVGAPSTPTGSGLNVGGIAAGGTFEVTGTVAAGATSIVTYRVQVNAPDTGDHQLDNFLVVTGTTPPPSCVATDSLCTTNPVPALVVSKSVNPASTTPVAEGQVLTYTLTFDNSAGKAPAAVDYTDDLTKVTDDASITSGPVVASGSGLAVGNNIGDTYEISGTLAAGASETITYQVTVDTPDVGDHRLDNFLVVTGTTPPPSCVPSDPLCTTNPVPALVVSKSVNPASTTPVAEGQVLTFTLRFDNSAGKAPAAVNYTDDLTKVLDDATVTGTPSLATGTGLTVGLINSGTFPISGTVAAGATATVTYQVTVNTPDTGDHRLDNFLVVTGNAPPPSCVATDPLCTTNPVPGLAVSKSVNPASGTTVVQGQVLTYTLTFDNTNGKAPAAVDYTDDLTKVTDDASITSGPSVASGSGLSVGNNIGDTYEISGTLAAGASETITYQVTVDTPDVGDHRLDNFLVVTGTTPPPSCVATDPLCTTNPVPALVVSKSVNPASGTTVVQGQVLTYTLTFDNSAGKAPAAVNYTDDLSKVLDDATVTSAPTSVSGSGLNAGGVSGTSFPITGTLAAGATATVTYQVTVNTPDTGDHRLDNFLVVTGNAPPPNCVPSDPTCTTNPVPDLHVSKSVNPASGTTVNEGQVLTYTLTFDNTVGQAAATVGYTDDLTKVLDDATITAPPALASGSGLTVHAISGGTFAVTGTLAAGSAATVTYQVTVNTPDTGDHQLDNFLVVTGRTPPPSCAATDPLCTTNPVPDLIVTKSSSPGSTKSVVEGQAVTYTLTFDNSGGKAPATVDWVDHLAKVLDDATVTTQPGLATGTGLVVGSISNGSFAITGTLAAGAKATVTYVVTVNTPDTGDHQLDNFVVPGDTNPPPTCLPSNPDCTTNPDPALKVSKSVNPVSGSLVEPGQVLTYTITFDNRTGKAPAPIAWTDDLTRLLDDAVIISAPTLTTGSGIAISPISNGKFEMTGSLAAGSLARVTYRARVDDPDSGNRHLDNFLVLPGTNPPPTCVVGNALDTCNHSGTSSSAEKGQGGHLAHTGAPLNPITWSGIGIILMLLGLGCTVTARRRRS